MKEDVEDFIDALQGLLDNETYRFAWDTLQGIKNTVSSTQNVTKKQIQAYENIKSSRDGTRETKEWKRGYEGFS